MNRPGTATLDEAIVTTILTRHFPMATPADINDAARDVILLELLADDRRRRYRWTCRSPQAPDSVGPNTTPIPIAIASERSRARPQTARARPVLV